MLIRLALFIAANPMRFAVLVGLAAGAAVRISEAYLESKVLRGYRELHRREFPDDPNCPICNPPN